MNHEGFQQRLELAEHILQRYGLNAKSIDPVEYDAACKFPYNNFIYKISLSQPVSSGRFPAEESPCCAKPGLSEEEYTVILRLSNPKADGLGQAANRIENEVAAIHLARKGLDTHQLGLGNLVPSVYAWQSAKPDTLGWILMDFKSGVPLDSCYADLAWSDKKSVIDQIAALLAGIQKAPLPPQVAASYGGLFVDSQGTLTSGPMVTVKGGPWTSYHEFWRSKFASQLHSAERSPALQGWSPNGVRQKIDDFISTRLPDILRGAQIDACGPTVLSHGDLTMNNMLFDPETKKITALLDFDFASISHPSQEFFSSLADVGGNVLYSGGPELTEALLKGKIDDHGPEMELDEDTREMWRSACVLDAALAASKALRPCEITGMTVLVQLAKLDMLLSPFGLTHPVPLGRKTPEQISDERKVAEDKLVTCLEQFH